MSGGIAILVGGLGMLGVAVPALAARARNQRLRRQVVERLQTLVARGQGAAGEGEAGAARRELPASLPRWLRVMLAQADFVPGPGLLGLAAMGTGALAALAWWGLGWVVGLVALGLLLASGPLGLRLLAQRRIAAMIGGLPFYFDALRQMLMAGSALQQALVRASENADPAMRRYLLPMVRRLQNGASVGDSLNWLAHRLDVAELHMFALSVQANIHYGGRLSTVLASLGQALRDRTRVGRELRAATAETRVGAIVIGSLPVVTGILMTIINPAYLPFFRDTAEGHQLLLVALALQLSGVLVMRRLMRLDY